MLIYVFCYNDQTTRQAEALAKQHDFLRPYRLGPSPFFESQFFTMKPLPFHEWMHHDFVGFISYKYPQKVTDDNVAEMPTLCRNMASCDVIALNDTEHELLPHAIKMHGEHFLRCWDAVLEPFYPEDTRHDLDIPAFFCNFWLAKPTWLIEYCKFAHRVKQHIDTHPHVQNMLCANSNYRGSLRPQELMGITNNPHYTFHAFLFERLPCIFFHEAHATIGRRRRKTVWAQWQPFCESDVSVMIPEKTKKLCLFATHSELDHFEHNILQYLANLAPHFDLVLVLSTQAFVMNARDIPPNCVVKFVHNQCHDFGMWFRVLLNLPRRALETVALVNDSCIILDSLQEVFARASVHPDWKFWGITDSQEIQHHLQTYFVVVHGDAIDVLVSFVRQCHMSPRLMSNKGVVIRDFEVGLSEYMSTKHVSINAIFPYKQVKWCRTLLNGQGVNPSLALWDRLLVLGCPLLKKRRLQYRGEAEFIKHWSVL